MQIIPLLLCLNLPIISLTIKVRQDLEKQSRENEVPYLNFHIEESNRDPLDEIRSKVEFKTEKIRNEIFKKNDEDAEVAFKKILQIQNTNLGTLTALEHSSSNILKKLHEDYHRDDLF